MSIGVRRLDVPRTAPRPRVVRYFSHPKNRLSAPARPSRLQGGRARARSAVVWGIASFLLLGLGLNVVFLLHPDLRDANVRERLAGLKERLANAPHRPLTVVAVGSSRTVNGLRPIEVEPALADAAGRPVVAHNLGMYGAGPVGNLRMLHRLRWEGIRPDIVLIEVFPPLLAERPSPHEIGPEMLPTASLRADEMELIERFGGPARANVRGDWLATHLAPAYYHRRALIGQAVPSLLTREERSQGYQHADRCGWLGLPGRSRDPERTERQRRGYQDGYFRDFRLGGPSADAVHASLGLCRREEIRAVLVLMPEGPTFRGWYSDTARAQIDEFLSDMRREYGVEVWDLRDWMTEDDFLDSHHLLTDSAAAFSERLGRERLVPLVRSLAATK